MRSDVSAQSPSTPSPVAGEAAERPRPHRTRSAPVTRPGSGLLHAALPLWAARTPDAPAIHWRGRQVSYRELEERSGRLAQGLARAGVRPGSVVGVCLRRTPELVSALFGVLKNGCSYLPLDPDYPPERLNMMLLDSGAEIVIVDSSSAPTLSAGVRTFDVADLESSDVPCGPAQMPATSPREVAYLIYTSGSTGRPKGVAIEHRSAQALAAWAAETFTGDLDGVLAATSVCFDLSVFEIFGTIAAGGRMVLVDNVLELVHLPPDVGVRLVNTVPSAMSELLAADALPASVRTVCLAGERFPAALAAALWRTPQVRRVCNLYGPSEDTTYSTWAELVPGAAGEPPIGAPLPGTRAHVLDADLRPVADGAEGELFLTGAGLARGYLGRPRETAAAFLPDPHSPRPGDRMYRTGDRVRRDPDGTLHYIGRTDDQVKVRGYRIELGEVSAALHLAPGVRAAAATVVTGPSGENRLAGYVVALAGGAGDTEAVLRHLRATLPSQLVPTVIVWQDGLPRTPSGKVDRAALPAPRWETAAPRGAPDAVGTAVADIWRELVGTTPEVDSDFFANGGDSLSAVRFAVRVRQVCGRQVPYTLLFDNPTLATLRAAVDGAPTAADPTGDDGDPAAGPLTPAQHRLWFLQELDPQDTSYLISVLVEVTGVASVERLTDALRAVVARHAALRTAFVADADGHPVQHVAREPAPTVSVVGLAPGEDPTARARDIAAADATRPVPIDRPGPLRAHVVHRDGTPLVLALTLHHIVFDGWSLGLLVRDLGRQLAGTTTDTPPPGGPLAAARRHRRWSAETGAAVATERLAAAVRGAPTVLDLPVDAPPPDAAEPPGRQHRQALDPALTAAARACAGQHAATLYMVGLGAFGLTLGAWCGRDDLLVGTAFAGRTSAEDEAHIGCFVNILPVRTPLAAAATFTELLGSIRENTLVATRHQDVPFDRLVEHVRPPRLQGRNPLVQVAFGVRTEAAPTFVADGLRLRGREVTAGHSRLDLTLWLEESEDGVEAVWTYPTRLFRPTTISRLHQRFVTVLAAAAAAPERPIGDLQAARPAQGPLARRKRNG
ncbi:amino acid adenylation domain-containing protein [Micromonospora sp. NPDC005298]|uniref:amino acid adenylation domain-containing protein n=1 Tax=Micromonospora sp. NPDC005298 TaxID=3156873 RepID=UPI00339E6928